MRIIIIIRLDLYNKKCTSVKILKHTENLFPVMYNLKMKLGEVKGSGADGNVYIQLFGSTYKGNTAKIQLCQAADEKNRFETGQEYKFIVTTLDIGKVQCTLYMYLMIRLQAQGLYEFQSTYEILQHKTVRALEP